ncbi:class I SAM-dependent methyltransferase [Niveispirillum sp. KHB5.9]|uniref:class I SAM-dependent methyltransferase n=1 Tax=Niveispirillum sp. KHB5.9 TaxID=3400269 RepID=UPI003A856C8E
MQALETEFAEYRWFHSIDMGDFATSGRFPPGSAQNVTLFGFMDMVRHIDLSGMTVLDIGAINGLASFGMKKMGAETVHATDSSDHKTFRRCAEVLELDVNYHPRTQIKDFGGIFESGTFDLILCAGVIYHMLNPVSAFIAARKIIKEGGLLFMETAYYPDEERAAIFLNSETAMVDEHYTYSVPTKAALVGLMKLLGFEVLAIRTIANPNRITILGRAVHPSGISDRSPILQRIHSRDFVDFEFRIKDVIPTPASSEIVYAGPRDEQAIDHVTYEPDFPLHPERRKRVVGSTLWETRDGNR